VNTEFKILLLL